ncbi:MAG TPA: inorganic phosphate transporter [Dermatophilaceae bacterium]|jgi:PiT family inorganic phosphate transporter|nr:inorganic phosphate transporter [Actinomycetales bacterium]HMT34030.1 inorganic phosphate transporter [Dermatophilaceae bacterium]HMT90450.1 inorganic phosphate transporter [Dermatophilaceae bacterium]
MVVVTALAFDFTNGFHDTGNAMASSIATGALSPKAAVTLAATLDLVGALISVKVALTITNAVIDGIQQKNGLPNPDFVGTEGGKHGTLLLLVVLAGLVGGIVWNLFTWLLGLPSSSSHALLGGLVGATIAGFGFSQVNWLGHSTEKLDGVVGKVLLPSLISPVIAFIVAAVGTRIVFKLTEKMGEKFRESRFRWGQVGSASLVALAHGTNDAQKTMGVITLALIAAGEIDTNAEIGIPLWVKVSAAVAIALGTYLGGWRIMRTLGKGIVDINAPQGFAGDTSTASVILASSGLGFALSTTHVASGSIMGAGVGRKGAEVRWSVAGRMASAWAITFPAAAVVGGLMLKIGDGLPGLLGPSVVMLIVIGVSLLIWVRSRKDPVDKHSVGKDWDAEPDAAPVVEAAQHVHH